ncbi:D-alanyl-lipoteichoic acid biosynthesis protein DltD [Peptostreptococcus faecalis]|uniref:D-alanyl-lipoteichoic acid biosynthesis protein DltD n=1 Tax=Peptostreptococcus faecalis TaxID=2045015 RepID=UPI000C7A3EC1|nr:D-alanyl-lipoteichoic acid biosynthesis protein DltD [Peptostreptococcus faecalis]
MSKLKYIIPSVIVPIVIGVAFTFGFDGYIKNKDTEMLKTKDLYPILHDTQSLVKDKGVFANDYLANEGYMLLMGSSELSHSTRQHPDLYFNTGRTKVGAITIGRAYTQSLQHATVVGSLDPNIKDKKAVLLLSMQWFMDKEGVTKNHFQTRFSPVQFYSFMNNSKISHKTKMKFANRVKELLGDDAGEYKAEVMYAKMYTDNSAGNSIMKTMFKPYFAAREYMVGMKDKGLLFKKLVKEYDKTNKTHDIKGKINWEKEKEDAKRDAMTRVGKKIGTLGGKKMYVDKGYYREYIKKKDHYFKDFYSYVNLTDSKEYGDLEIFMDVCKDLEIEPVIVLVPGMEEFYDYAGINKEERNAYYKKVESEIKPYKHKLIDLRSYENKRYYLRDIMHIGTMGWVDLCERLYNIYER